MSFPTEFKALVSDIWDVIEDAYPGIKPDMSPIIGSNFGGAYDPDTNYVRFNLPWLVESRQSGGCDYWANDNGMLVLEIFASTSSGAAFDIAWTIRDAVRNYTTYSHGPTGIGDDWEFYGPRVLHLGNEESHNKTNVEIKFKRGFQSTPANDVYTATGDWTMVTVPAVAHSFVPYDSIYFNESSVPVLATLDDGIPATHMVVSTLTDSFQAQDAGYVFVYAGHGLPTGKHYLDNRPASPNSQLGAPTTGKIQSVYDVISGTKILVNMGEAVVV